MAKKQSAPFYKVLGKKSTTTTLIALLIWAIYQLTSQVETKAQPVILPSSSIPVQIYSNQGGDNLQQLYVQTIDSAKKSITFVEPSSFVCSNPLMTK